MIEATEQAQELVSGIGVEALDEDRQRRDALLWNFTVLGEAAAELSVDVKDRFPDIPWARPARLRNRVVHGYWAIDLEIVHTTATNLTQRAAKLAVTTTQTFADAALARAIIRAG